MSVPPRKTRRALAVLVGLAIATSTMPAAIAARLPDLRIARVTGVDATEQRGEPFQARVSVRNGGRATAAKSQAAAYLSEDSAKSRSDARLGKVNVGRIAKGKSAIVTIRAQVPQDTEPGAYYLIVCADSTTSVREANERNNCLSQPMGVEPGPTTSDLLDAAVARGEIDDEAALLYEVFGSFGDSRFPERYRGDDEFETDAHGLREAALTFETLSLDTQEALIPFLQPPVYPETWEDLPTAAEPPERRRPSRQTESPPALPALLGDEGWFYFEHNHARIWFQDKPIQRDAAQIVYENLDQIWTDLTLGMDRAPLSDAGPHVLETKDGQKVPWGDGGGGKLDIYLTDAGEFVSRMAVTIPYGSCCPRPSFIVMNPANLEFSGSWRGITFEKYVAGVTAHEFMHVLQLTYDRDVTGEPRDYYFKMNEGVADFAIQYVFPDNNLEHIHNDMFLDWNDFARPNLWEGEYDAWPFFLYLDEKLGSQIIKKIYATSDEQQDKEIWQAVDSALSGKLDEHLFEFSRYLLNDTPEETRFELWDGILKHHTLFHPDYFHPISLEGKTEREFPLVDPTRKLHYRNEPNLYSLASRHVSYRFEDNNITKIVIENKNAGQPGAHLGAYLQLADGDWKPFEDWSNRSTITLCRELASENVTDMVLVFANSRTAYPEDSIDLSQSKLKVSEEGGCGYPERWTGTASGTLTYADGHIVETWSASVSVKLLTSGPGVAYYSAEHVTWLWEIEGSLPPSASRPNGCTYTGSDTWTVEDPGAAGMTILEDPDVPFEYSVGLSSGHYADVTVRCEGEVQESWRVLNIADEAVSGAQPWTPGTRAVSGSASYESSSEEGAIVDWQWSLTAAE